MVYSTWVMLSQCRNVTSMLGTKDCVDSMYCSHSDSIAQECQYLQLQKNLVSSYKNSGILQLFLRILKDSTKYSNKWEYRNKKYPILLIQYIGLNISLLLVENTSVDMEFMLIVLGHLSPRI